MLFKIFFKNVLKIQVYGKEPQDIKIAHQISMRLKLKLIKIYMGMF